MGGDLIRLRLPLHLCLFLFPLSLALKGGKLVLLHAVELLCSEGHFRNLPGSGEVLLLCPGGPTNDALQILKLRSVISLSPETCSDSSLHNRLRKIWRGTLELTTRANGWGGLHAGRNGPVDSPLNLPPSVAAVRAIHVKEAGEVEAKST